MIDSHELVAKFSNANRLLIENLIQNKSEPKESNDILKLRQSVGELLLRILADSKAAMLIVYEGSEAERVALQWAATHPLRAYQTMPSFDMPPNMPGWIEPRPQFHAADRLQLGIL